jgi:hypothetical protein
MYALDRQTGHARLTDLDRLQSSTQRNLTWNVHVLEQDNASHQGQEERHRSNPKFHCPSGDTVQAALKGKIPKNGNSGLPAGDTGLLGSVKATVCVDSAFNVSLLAGTTFAL